VFRVHAPKYNNATRRPFPKRESLKNKSSKRWQIFQPQNTTFNSPQIATIPPQIHHQKTTSNRPFSPKPTAKREISAKIKSR
jgi:hypothetical protein